MEVKFKDKALEEIFLTGKTKDCRYKIFCRNKKLVDGYARAVRVMQGVESASRLSEFSYLHYEKLKHLQHKSSVRIVNGYIERLLFTESPDGIEVELIEINNTHYDNK